MRVFVLRAEFGRAFLRHTRACVHSYVFAVRRSDAYNSARAVFALCALYELVQERSNI